MNELFTKPMAKLENNGMTETIEYKDLSDFREMTNLLIPKLFEDYGDATNGLRYVPDISNLEAVPGNRIGCLTSVEYGKSFVRPEPYTRPNMFNNYAGMNDDWCAMFTNYVHEKCSCGEHQHSSTQIKSMSTGTIMAMARSRNQWADMNYMTPAPGDWILFNWRYDVFNSNYCPWMNGCGHVGIVTHTDGERVYYVHGNTGGDRVQTASRPLTDDKIRGYVVMFP